MKTNIKETYDVLQKNRKKIKRRSIFLATFLFCVNAYAWFIYAANANGNINADIVSWSVNFYENNTEIREFDINFDSMYPGMTTDTKTILIKNGSDIPANLTYEIDSFSLLGVNYDLTSTEMINKLENELPFKIELVTDKTELANNDDVATFEVIASWPYESNDYYKLTSDYEYSDYIKYYTLSGSNYVIANITSSNFTSNINKLYISKDDADTYWAEKCSLYKEENNTDCLKIHMNISVTQKDLN